MLLTWANPVTPNMMWSEMYENILPQPCILSLHRQVTSGEQNLFNKNRTEPTHHPHLILGLHKQCCHSARSLKAETQNPWSSHEPSTSIRGGSSQTVGEGLESVCFTVPHPPWRAPSPLGRRFFSTFWNSGFCNSGQGCPSCRMTKRGNVGNVI